MNDWASCPQPVPLWTCPQIVDWATCPQPVHVGTCLQFGTRFWEAGGETNRLWPSHWNRSRHWSVVSCKLSMNACGAMAMGAGSINLKLNEKSGDHLIWNWQNWKIELTSRSSFYCHFGSSPRGPDLNLSSAAPRYHRFLVATSHRWEKPNHLDPESHHLKVLKEFSVDEISSGTFVGQAQRALDERLSVAWSTSCSWTRKTSLRAWLLHVLPSWYKSEGKSYN